MRQLLYLTFLIFITTPVYCTTWDEPWHDKVLKEADIFIKGDILESYEKRVVIKVNKILAGEELRDTIILDNFYALDLCSSSGGHGAEFHFGELRTAYFFLKKNKDSNYSISTPTSGFEYEVNKGVVCTYRHSYHHALVPIDVFEKTMTAIFNYYKKKDFDTVYINNFIEKQLSQTPAFFDGEKQDVFFLQHVALELIYHLKLNNYYEKVLPFLRDSKNFHNQISAARALNNYITDNCKEELFKVISDSVSNNFSKVVCIWTLSNFDLGKEKTRILELEKNASTEETGFGGSIMDPRVCTDIPTPKIALKKLLTKIK